MNDGAATAAPSNSASGDAEHAKTMRGRQSMDDTLMNRLRQWLTPEHPLPLLGRPPAVPVMRHGFRLYVLGIDGLSRALLEADTRQAAFERLRDRLFPNLSVRIDANDVDELTPDGSELWLTQVASTRWLTAARRSPTDVGFSFLYSPFAVAVDGACRIGGWVVPTSSGSPFPYARLHASICANRVALRVLPGPGSSENPALMLQSARSTPCNTGHVGP